jgi:hypothetical protein
MLRHLRFPGSIARSPYNNHMKQFRLSRQPQPPGATLTKFHVLSSDSSIVGSINVPNEEANDLQKHWLGGQKAPAAAAGNQNPMVTAMVAAARRHPLNKQAILRGC